MAKLYTDIVKNGYEMMYLTSRAIGQADGTRMYLKGVRQDGDGVGVVGAGLSEIKDGAGEAKEGTTRERGKGGPKKMTRGLPDGPVIMSPDGVMVSLHREVIMRKPEMFKMACLRDIQRIFREVNGNPNGGTPFYAGFGNRITDALSYRSVDVPSMRIFTIDHTGEVKMELLELAGYKSS